jgi:hypothetical protein
MAEDGLTYSEAVRAAAAEAAEALGTSPEAVPQRAIRARRQRGNGDKAGVLLELEKDKAAPRKRSHVQPADARTTMLDACIADLRSLLAKAEEWTSDERSGAFSYASHRSPDGGLLRPATMGRLFVFGRRGAGEPGRRKEPYRRRA